MRLLTRQMEVRRSSRPLTLVLSRSVIAANRGKEPSMFVHPDTDSLPHEPLRVRKPTLSFLLVLGKQLLLIILTAPLSAAALPVFLLGVLLWGWPPHQTRLSEAARYIKYAWSQRPPPPGIAPLSRVWLTLQVLQKLGAVPLHGVAWQLDEVLYGRQLQNIDVVAPLFVLSAARSGSTQISRYLEDDPGLSSPSVLQIVFPYLWLWRIAPFTLGRFFSRDDVHAIFHARITEEFRQRHEGDPFHTDTIEILFYSQRLHLMSPMFGPKVTREEFGPVNTAPHNRRLWEQDFIAFIDRLGRKSLVFDGPDADNKPKRLFIKGHFIEARDALARRYPEAHFLTIIRDPVSRLRSVVNHLHGNPFAEELGAIPWSWIVASVVDIEADYCQIEQTWFNNPDGPARTVVRFTDFTNDLKGTMSTVYRNCMGSDTLPAHIPTEHPPRERKSYRVNRTLLQLGVDVDALTTRLSDYRAWCAGDTSSG